TPSPSNAPFASLLPGASRCSTPSTSTLVRKTLKRRTTTQASFTGAAHTPGWRGESSSARPPRKSCCPDIGYRTLTHPKTGHGPNGCSAHCKRGRTERPVIVKVVFRTDASLNMGSGHVMRCLTLADALKVQGAQCHFISREHPGHLLEVIRQRGYKVNHLVAHTQHAQGAIKSIVHQAHDAQQEPAHTAWLGSSWQADAQETAAILAALQPDWLVVDHYALDRRWEEVLAPHYRQLLVIDDLADR